MKVEYFVTERIHIVKPAETYQSIAARYSLSENDLRLKNKGEQLFIGKRLCI